MTAGSTSAPFPVAARVGRFSYAIRNIVAEARRVEAAGVRVRYLNIGDPISFGFKTPPHLVEAVIQALRDGHSEYGPSAGLPAAREAVATECTNKGFPVTPDRVFVTAGTSEAIELTLNALLDTDDEALVPLPTYPMYTAVLGKLGGRAKYYPLDPDRGWTPELDKLESLVTPRTRVLVMIDPNNPTGACFPDGVRRALIAFAETHNLVIVADEVYNDVRYAGESPLLGHLEPDAPIISLSSLSKAFLAPGWRTGWMAIGRTKRLDAVVAAVAKMTDARLCTTLPMQYAIAPALLGDRSHQPAVPACVERARRSHGQVHAGHPRRHVRRARSRVLRVASNSAAAGAHRRALRALAAAQDGRARRLRIWLRAAPRTGVHADRLPRAS